MTRRTAPRQVGAVTRTPKLTNGAQAIVAAVTSRRQKASDDILARLQEMKALLDERHRQRAESLIPLAMKMDAQTLVDFIEIGRQMTDGSART